MPALFVLLLLIVGTGSGACYGVFYVTGSQVLSSTKIAGNGGQKKNLLEDSTKPRRVTHIKPLSGPAVLLLWRRRWTMRDLPWVLGG